MDIYFVRHGDPNYKDNCLTPLGHLQAEACAERFKECADRFPELALTSIFTSKYGRARETAEHTAAKLGLPVTELDFIHEISSGRPEITDREENLKYTAWLGADLMVYNEGADLLKVDWDNNPVWGGNRFKHSYERVVAGLDPWLETFGFKREGACYRCLRSPSAPPERPAVFAHAGSISCVIAHLLNLPAPFVTGHFHLQCTGITVFDFEEREGSLITPRIRRLNDADHIRGLKVTEADTNPQ